MRRRKGLHPRLTDLCIARTRSRCSGRRNGGSRAGRLVRSILNDCFRRGPTSKFDPEQTVAEQECGHQLRSRWTAGTGGLPLETHPWEAYLCRRVHLLRSPAAALPSIGFKRTSSICRRILSPRAPTARTVSARPRHPFGRSSDRSRFVRPTVEPPASPSLAPSPA